MLYESRCMWSVAYHAPRTVSESCYVIFGFWNCVASIYLHCRRDIQRILIIILLKTWFIYFLNGLNPYESTDMARWQDTIGPETICTIVKTLTPTWNDGLHPVQLELVSTTLDGQDMLCCTATGDGKLLKLVRELLFVTTCPQLVIYYFLVFWFYVKLSIVEISQQFAIRIAHL